MADEAIFRGEGGRQIKFFVQKDLEAKIIENLHNQITVNGGRVETKVPIQGFVLIEPKSTEGLRLLDCWDTADRPLRCFVPYTFVAACLEAQKLIPQVFRKNGVALRMHIHPCITNETIVEKLRDRIWHSGGDPLATEYEADIIIADESWSGFRALVERFDHFHNKYVEAVHWVKQCIESGVYENTPVVKKNLGGRVSGNKRTEFTVADDDHLARYIANRLPDSSMRGRTGNKLYQDLCSRHDMYPWAERHPWQSWRERYKNNAPRFSNLISTYLEHHPVPEDGKGLHGFVRISSTHSKSHAKQPNAEDFGSEREELTQRDVLEGDREWGSQWNVRVGNKSPPPWGRGKRKAVDDADGLEGSNQRKKYQHDGNCKDGQSSQLTDDMRSDVSNVALDGNSRRADTKELGGAEPGGAAESSNAAPHSDSSRTRSRSPGDSNGSIQLNSLEVDSEDEAVGHETQALLDYNREILASLSKPSSRAVASPLNCGQPQDISDTLTAAKLPPTVRNSTDADVEHALVRIACEYRFVLDEVKEEYEELNHDLEATRAHFKEIRAIIVERKSSRKKELCSSL